MPTLTRLIAMLPPDHTPEDADMLQALLSLHVSHGWEEQSLATGEMQCVVHFTVAECAHDLRDVLAVTLPDADLQLEQVEEQNWVEAWKEFFTPVKGGEHFLVLAPWMEEERRSTRRIPIIIEPKTAFGTGHHDTTALCLEAISTLYAQEVITEGMRFLDLGTGSGILGLGCVKLGLTGEGLDIDPPAVENAVENRHTNGIAPDAFTVRLGGVEEATGTYDIILANILAEPLRAMAPQIAALRDSNGKRPVLVLSGLLAIQADAVRQAYRAQGYPEPRSLIRGEWASLIFIS